MNIFVTGSTGNMGIHLMNNLRSSEYDITCLIRNNNMVDDTSIKSIQGDLNSIDRYGPCVINSDVIIHLASPRSIDRQTVIKQDIEGTAKLLDCWNKGKFIFMSSQTVYNTDIVPFKESLKTDAATWYDIGKICNEMQIKIKCDRNSDLTGIVFRPPLLFGSGKRLFDRQYLMFLLIKCIEGKTFVFDSEETMYESGTSYLSEKDCSNVIMKSIDYQKKGFHLFNLSSGFATWKEVIDLINKYARTKSNYCVLNNNREKSNEFVRLPQTKSQLDMTTFKMEFGYEPIDSLEQIIGEFVHNALEQSVYPS